MTAAVAPTEAPKVETTPTPIPPTPTPLQVATAPRIVSQPLGNKEQWMTAAGITQSDWQYVDYVIAGKPDEKIDGEGGWNGTQRWNTKGSGAYGLCQSLPASKMASAGADYMTNPVTQLKWCNGYAHDRYGGWVAAWTFRKCVGRCWQPVWQRYQIKDHTWW